MKPEKLNKQIKPIFNVQLLIEWNDKLHLMWYQRIDKMSNHTSKAENKTSPFSNSGTMSMRIWTQNLAKITIKSCENWQINTGMKPTIRISANQQLVWACVEN